MLLLLATLAAAPVPKASADDKLRDLFGKPTDPAMDVRFEPVDGGMRVRVPGGDRTLEPEAMNAPRTGREVEGDFAVEVVVAIKFDPDSAPAGKQGVGVSGGILVTAEDGFVVTLGYKHLRPGGNPGGVWCSPSEYSARGPGFDVGSLGPQKFTPDRPMHLRLTRKGDQVVAAWSPDGKAWKIENGGNEKCPLPAKVTVGVFATQQTEKPADVTFTGYKLAAGK